MATYNKKILFLVVNGVEISITDTPRRISDLEDYLYELRIPKNGVSFVLTIEEFSLFQDRLLDLLRLA